ncbi:MAG: hypothetical protein EOO38_17010 [Cytophagaceae bacterium]|nr:MAG: hypothetical protein EOO38_17010 [Cytophagaceae bacterium]
MKEMRAMNNFTGHGVYQGTFQELYCVSIVREIFIRVMLLYIVGLAPLYVHENHRSNARRGEGMSDWPMLKLQTAEIKMPRFDISIVILLRPRGVGF